METTQKLHISLLFTSFDLHLGQREAGKCGTCLCRHMPNNNAPITLQQNGFGGWLLSVRALRFFLLCWCSLCTGIPPFFPIQFFLETIYCFLQSTSVSRNLPRQGSSHEWDCQSCPFVHLFIFYIVFYVLPSKHLTGANPACYHTG